ncbi:EamA family transporter RarD [Paenibacillus nanensis]|uniref:EamA family transporter RarD n=1 Tax=Paenibacillus nanensis TaxID=393251 RepID=A0A3A1UVY0_9BACL|nr:EamA family transporter RarD [Paenibacillus nanensis]RIX48615.1 EamA family transporter RarD [Paenibacillus nanensis]
MKNGLLYAIIAYIMWGLLPLYWKLFETTPAGEILSHRIIWSFVFVAILIAAQRKWSELRALAANRSSLLSLTVSSLLITANWMIFIWAVNNGHVVETSLGYYLTPLLNVLLGILFLREKPSKGQWLAVALAGAGVLFVAIDYGRFPWISVSLALSFGLYGLAKKKVSLESSLGLFMETAVVTPLALLYWIYLGATHTATAWSLSAGSLLLLLLAGAATALPLLFFAKAAKQLPLSTLGFVQYIGPSITLLLSVLVFDEHISTVLLVSFSLIWAALVVFAMSSIRRAKSPNPAAR